MAKSDSGHPSNKKGVGVSEKEGIGVRQIKDLNVQWYYNWNFQTSIESDVEFVPMIFSDKTLSAKIKSDYVLGYNEPDNQKQSNIPVQKAIDT